MPLLPIPPRQERPELIDSVAPSDRDFAASFGDIARVNRYLGGTRAVFGALAPLIAALPSAPRPVTLLDVATGSGDIPRAIVQQARRGGWGGRPVRVVATDNHPKVLALARRSCLPYPEITIEKADAFALPYADRSFDIALCSLAFHHFGFEDAVRALRELGRVARTGFIVNDLVRDWAACGLIWLLTRLLRANRLTRHDAPLSVLRAFTPDEYVRMAHAAGISSYKIRTAPFFRAVLVGAQPVGQDLEKP